MTGLNNERLSSNDNDVSLLLTAYATGGIIANAAKMLEFDKQTLDVYAALCAKNLYIRALRCGVAYEKKSSSYYSSMDWRSRFEAICAVILSSNLRLFDIASLICRYIDQDCRQKRQNKLFNAEQAVTVSGKVY